MTGVRRSSLCERPCAGIEETGKRHRMPEEWSVPAQKVHSLIDKVYDPANLAEAGGKSQRRIRVARALTASLSPGSSNDRTNFWRGCTSSCERRPSALTGETGGDTEVCGVEREISAFRLSETGWFNRPWCRR